MCRCTFQGNLSTVRRRIRDKVYLFQALSVYLLEATQNETLVHFDSSPLSRYRFSAVQERKEKKKKKKKKEREKRQLRHWIGVRRTLVFTFLAYCTGQICTGAATHNICGKK